MAYLHHILASSRQNTWKLQWAAYPLMGPFPKRNEKMIIVISLKRRADGMCGYWWGWTARARNFYASEGMLHTKLTFPVVWYSPRACRNSSSDTAPGASILFPRIRKGTVESSSMDKSAYAYMCTTGSGGGKKKKE